MSELSGALGLPLGVSDLLERAADELSYGAPERTRDLCDRAIEKMSARSPRLGAALYLRGLASEGEMRVESLREAVALLMTSIEPSQEAEARLALAETLLLSDSSDATAELERAARLFEDLRDEYGMARVTLGLGRAALVEQRRDEARRSARLAIESLERVETIAARRAEVRAHELIGDAAVDPRAALDSYREALEVAGRSNVAPPGTLREKLERLRARRGPFR